MKYFCYLNSLQKTLCLLILYSICFCLCICMQWYNFFFACIAFVDLNKILNTFIKIQLMATIGFILFSWIILDACTVSVKLIYCWNIFQGDIKFICTGNGEQV